MAECLTSALGVTHSVTSCVTNCAGMGLRICMGLRGLATEELRGTLRALPLAGALLLVCESWSEPGPLRLRVLELAGQRAYRAESKRRYGGTDYDTEVL